MRTDELCASSIVELPPGPECAREVETAESWAGRGGRGEGAGQRVSEWATRHQWFKEGLRRDRGSRRRAAASGGKRKRR